MATRAVQLIEECVQQFKEGNLTEAQLRELGQAIDSPDKRQSVLSLQANTTSVTEPVIGRKLITEGRGIGRAVRLG